MNSSHAEAYQAGGSSEQDDGPVVGLTSNPLECLAAGNHVPGKASGVVRLNWQGRAERARLMLSVSGAQASHTIKVNGQPVAFVPIYPDGQPCRNGEIFYLDIPSEVLVQGDNRIEITNDAMPNNSWTASQVQLEVFGHFPIFQAGGPGGISPLGVADVAASGPFTYTFTFTNSYDGSSQEFRAQIPSGYDSNIPAPLVIYVHGRFSDMREGDRFGAAANNKGWLLASPQLHGSWPGSTQYPVPNPPGQFAYASLESQYDVIGTVNYMLDHYNVITNQIYLIGSSMGGQIAVIVAAKFPHIFAGVFDNKGPTDMGQWYYEQLAIGDTYQAQWMTLECHISGVPQTPTQNPFCYQRRSGLNFASNFVHIPISLTHSISDTLVPIHHSRDLRDAINRSSPDRQAVLFEEDSHDPLIDGGSACNYHCYEPDPLSELNFLEQFVLNSHPTHINVTTDESKSYYWMNLALTGGDHWSQVSAIYDPISATVLATISDTRPLTVAFNLGATPITGTAGISQPGMGLPATTYLIKGGGNNAVSVYASDYLTVPLASTGKFSLTISAIDASLSANPPHVAGGQASFSTITAAFKDHLNNPVPDGVAVEFSASAGFFPNGASIYTATTSGGRAMALLTLSPGFTSPLITASIGNVSATTSVEVIAPIYLPAIMRN